MPLLVFLLIGAVWAAFLLPSFFESRRHAPISATRNFQRSNELLASVAGANSQQILAKRRQAMRRRRMLLILSGGALVTLAAAIVTGSTMLLGLALVFDLLIGAYVTLLLMHRQRAYAAALAPRIGTPAHTAVDADSHEAPTRRERDREASQPATVRVVAG